MKRWVGITSGLEESLCRFAQSTDRSTEATMDVPWMEAVLMKNEMEESIIKVLDMKFTLAVPKGQNYTSKIYSADIPVILGSGRKTKRKLIIKEEIHSQKELLNEVPLFKTEIMCYQHLLIPMEELMEEFNDKGETLWCKYFGCKPYDMVVLEDLTVKNFVVAPRNECLDLKHSELVMRSLAKYHSMSKILMGRGIIGKDDFQPFYLARDLKIVKTMFSSGLNELAKAISSWPGEWGHVAKKIEGEVNTVCDKLFDLATTTTDDTFIVVNHGDPWTCNMMFKYSQDNEPIAVKFLDFQNTHFSSYMFDVLYFLHTSTKADVRRENHDRLLETYHAALADSLNRYRYSGKIPTIENVKAEAKRLEYYSFAILATIHAVTTAASTDALNLENLGEKSSESAINPEVLKSSGYMYNVGEDFKRFIKDNVF